MIIKSFLVYYVIIQGISETLGSGLIRQTSFMECGFDSTYDIFTANIRLMPT